jgi:hypothetical protein
MKYLPFYIVHNQKELKQVFYLKKKGYVFLDDRAFNKNKLSFLEQSIRQEGRGYYYNYEKDLFYDQFEVFKKSKRYIRSLPHPVKLIKKYVEPCTFKTFPFASKCLCTELLDGDFVFFAKNVKKEIEQIEGAFTK